ncbi:four helix bundle protein [Candidatus Falkowbacteria bacterium CG11_big_fil_rev_8_21_14_0_20_39_10]|uniref:Four helix bundle protein n=1 Tax=Candidatus Falkowbacteria bacterium CG11_big_fil_rev_8_21_14_0_20_39_10 TaxID=1974570 RepID=A0A2M6KAB6_9BACT|nr:MAG: four helix bundle protein [Candidatus Falkowbacteria bacterium CG11_big_fil_rev_8_21_14_0_20_39_10]
MKYDLEERTAKFGEEIIKFCRSVKEDNITRSLLSQAVRSGTSLGANYMEANQASSRKDFKNKIRICQKESNETKHWLRMIAMAVPEKKEECRILWKETHELTLIFAKISRSCAENK